MKNLRDSRHRYSAACQFRAPYPRPLDDVRAEGNRLVADVIDPQSEHVRSALSLVQGNSRQMGLEVLVARLHVQSLKNLTKFTFREQPSVGGGMQHSRTLTSSREE